MKKQFIGTFDGESVELALDPRIITKEVVQFMTPESQLLLARHYPEESTFVRLLFLQNGKNMDVIKSKYSSKDYLQVFNLIPLSVARDYFLGQDEASSLELPIVELSGLNFSDANYWVRVMPDYWIDFPEVVLNNMINNIA